ncbi:hypothetical protein FISHEDRAFT_55296 [Fistulina hepatica ATCC 64428]|uniref:Uncharacterized protein n=1 Tax=Fistulina hepatica ATCC 64428 TaxID=1128425 RepID=A0A0D7ANS1_9AGAR|nr:hypothetical protein FISHEDRAFT_55296 [Fistulina hepatica ATCC 64428]
MARLLSPGWKPQFPFLLGLYVAESLAVTHVSSNLYSYASPSRGGSFFLSETDCEMQATLQRQTPPAPFRAYCNCVRKDGGWALSNRLSPKSLVGSGSPACLTRTLWRRMLAIIEDDPDFDVFVWRFD